MRKIPANRITKEIRDMCLDVNFRLPPDVVKALKKGLKDETSFLGKYILNNLLKNLEIAEKESIPICQDTGSVVVFIELGQEINITGGSLKNAIDEGVKEAYDKGFLRKSIVRDPLDRKNTKDNTPAIIHTDIVPGSKVKIYLCAKGAGSENMSAIKMLRPADGIEGIKEFVIDQVRKIGANPCPPIIVGVGIGGNFEKSALLSKRALFRKLGVNNKDSIYAKLEKKLLKEINGLGIGPEGLGGNLTALAVNIETYPCHIASLPVAVNICCYVSRHNEITI